MGKLRTVLIVLFIVCLATALYLGWSDNGPWTEVPQQPKAQLD